MISSQVEIILKACDPIAFFRHFLAFLTSREKAAKCDKVNWVKRSEKNSDSVGSKWKKRQLFQGGKKSFPWDNKRTIYCLYLLDEIEIDAVKAQIKLFVNFFPAELAFCQ